MKYLKHFLILTLTLSLLGLPASAANKTSGWAAPEMERAELLGLLPDSGLPEDFTKPVTREEFRLLAMQYLAVCSRCDANTFRHLIDAYMAEHDSNGGLRVKFADGINEDSYAYYVGLVLGDGNGLFRPKDPITRQEVAVILLRAYMLCGGTAPETKATDFADKEEIADWAQEAASALTGLGAIKGLNDGRFDPTGLCTVEQAEALILRLYDSAPEKASPIFSEEECRGWLEARLKDVDTLPEHTVTIEGAEATFIREELNGVMRPSSSFYLLYKGGGLVSLDLGIQDSWYGPTQNMGLVNPAFSADGKTLSCSVSITQDVVYDGKTITEKGDYRITVNIDDPYHVFAVKQ